MSLHDLARTSPGETVLIRLVLFDGVRRACAERGIRCGTKARILENTGTHLLLELDGGPVVPVAQEWARFIDASRVAPYAA
jgi:hypothetical protein